MAVEFRPEETRRDREDLVRTQRLRDLALEEIHPLMLRGRQAFPGTIIDLRPPHPLAQRLSGLILSFTTIDLIALNSEAQSAFDFSTRRTSRCRSTRYPQGS